MINRLPKAVFSLRLVCGVLASALIGGAAIAEIPSGTTIKMCNDSNEWPPFFYNQRVDGKKRARLVGYDIDMLEQIFAPPALEFTIELISWKRCLLALERGQYDMITSAAYNAERDKKYLISEPYYTIQPHYFYFYSRYPDGLKIERLADFANYQVCGLQGYSYAAFGIPVESIDIGTKLFPEVLEKTQRGRCDIFLARYEIFTGYGKIGEDYVKTHNLGTAPMPGIEGDKFYMWVSREYEYAAELRDILNHGITQLKLSGEAERLLVPYLPVPQ